MKEENYGSFFSQQKSLDALTKFAFLTMRRTEYDSEITLSDVVSVLSLKNESLTILAA
jgi:hypothetical protein